LFYLAFQLWRANPEGEREMTTAPVGLWALARQEFLVAAGKPQATLSVRCKSVEAAIQDL
jgi:threonine/homoserine/homoserine lactone efflux protein